MANIKNEAFRESIIDMCLHSRRGYSTKEMMEECNNALECRGEPLITATNTIRNDILHIGNRWNVVIETIKTGRNIRYRYKDSNFSIFNCPLNENDITQLNQAVSTLRRFEGMPGLEWVDELNAHLLLTINFEKRKVVGFDTNKCLKGIEFFTPLFECICQKKVIELQYQSYKDKTTNTYIVHPYYLKEYNQRWFLFALNEGYQNITIFPLDRIKGLRKISAVFVENNKIDFENYFDKIIGVSSNKNGKSTLIVLRVNSEQLPYMLTKPLHHTQKVREHLQNGSAIVSINVIPNFELIQKILSFGERITVLEPETLREKIKHIVENNLKNYQ